jgi:hypothetical protein
VPFSGGHLNPAVTIAMHRFAPNKRMGKMIVAQVVGALLGAAIGIRRSMQRICSLEWCPTTTGVKLALRILPTTSWESSSGPSSSSCSGWSSRRPITWLESTSDICYSRSCCWLPARKIYPMQIHIEEGLPQSGAGICFPGICSHLKGRFLTLPAL